MIGKAIFSLLALLIFVSKGHCLEEASIESSFGEIDHLPFNCTGNREGIVCQIGSLLLGCDIWISPSELSQGNRTMLDCMVYNDFKMIGMGGLFYYDALDLTTAEVCSISDTFNGILCYKYNEPQVIDGKIKVCSFITSDTETGHVDTPLSCAMWTNSTTDHNN